MRGLVLVGVLVLPSAAGAVELACGETSFVLDDGDQVAVFLTEGQDSVMESLVEERRETADGEVIFLDGGVGGYDITVTVKGDKGVIEHRNNGELFRTDACTLVPPE